jgi:ankyrin repeat protein
VDTRTKDFFELVREGTPNKIQEAIGAGADIEARDRLGLTALMYAAMINQNPEVITALLKAGADIKARGKDGKTALLNAGANLKARDSDGETALMYAATGNHNPEVIMAMLKAGANAKAKDNEGKTAFDYAQDNEKLKGTDAYWKLQEASQ